MPDLPQNLLRLVAERPGFVADVERAKATAKRTPVLRLSLDAFFDDPMRLYACLSYARHSGVEVRFLPPRSGPSGR